MAEYESDNMYPSNGEGFSPFTEPQEQTRDRQKEKAKVMEALKLSDEILGRLDERIAFYDSVDSIEVELSEDSEKFVRAWKVAQEIKQILLTEKEWLEDLVEAYKS